MKTFKDYGIDVPNDRSGQFYTTCPKCSHLRKKKTSKCLSVNLSQGVWRCHHCDFKGHLEFTTDEKRKYISQKEQENPIPVTYKEVALKNLTEGVYRWFLKRGISKPTVDSLNIGWNNAYISDLDCMKKAIAFPFLKYDQTVGVIYRTPDKHWAQEPGGEKIVYNYNGIIHNKIIGVCEGQMDVATMVECGFDCFCSVGPAPDPKTTKYENSLLPTTNAIAHFDNADKIYIAMDKDKPGVIWEDVVISKIGKGKCLQVLYPSDCKDMNDVLVKYGKEKVKECIKNAQPYPISGVKGFEDLQPEIDDLVEGRSKPLKLTSSGVPGLDHITMLPQQGVWTVTGAPQSCKSTFCHNLIKQTIKEWNWLVFSGEHSHIKHFQKMGKMLLYGKYRDNFTKEQAKYIIDYFKDRLKHIVIKDQEVSLEDILDRAKKHKFQYGLNCLLIDHFSLLREKSDIQTWARDYLRRCRLFASTYECNVITVAHPRKLVRIDDHIDEENQEQCNYRVAQPYDISDSKDWYGMSDMIFSLWRNLKYSNRSDVRLYVLKVKEEEVGAEGVVNLTVDRETGVLLKRQSNYSSNNNNHKGNIYG